jgi:hypothetical protein
LNRDEKLYKIPSKLLLKIIKLKQCSTFHFWHGQRCAARAPSRVVRAPFSTARPDKQGPWPSSHSRAVRVLQQPSSGASRPNWHSSPWPSRTPQLPRAQAATWVWAGKALTHLGLVWPGRFRPFDAIRWLTVIFARSETGVGLLPVTLESIFFPPLGLPLAPRLQACGPRRR